MIACRLSLPTTVLGVLALTTALGLMSVHPEAQARGGEKITGSGVATTETRIVTGFHSVVLGVGASVEVRQGDSEGFAITGDDNIVPLVETVVVDGALTIRWKGNANISPSYHSLAIVVSAKRIDALTVGGSGRIHAAQLKSSSLRATIGGSGEIALDALDTDRVHFTIGGSGRVTAAGRADTLEVAIAGSGELSAAKPESRRANIAVQGSARADVWAMETLNATIAGSGEVTYRGSPQVNRTLVGSGTVRQSRASS